MTDAMLYSIVGRQRTSDVEAATLGHFHLGEAKAVLPQIAVEEPYWTPYCLDHPQRRMIFVDTPPEVNLSEAVFAHLTQFHQARRVLAVPYESLEPLAAQVDLPQNLILVFSLARAGTTLMNRMLNQIDGVWSLSEPDIFTDLSLLKPGEFTAEETARLIRSATALVYRPSDKMRHHSLGLKFRSQSVFVADLFHQVYPDAKYLFLYRDGLSWCNSFYQFLQKSNYPVVLENKELIEFLLWQIVHEADMSVLERLVGHSLEQLAVEEFFAVMYAAHLEAYMDSLNRGVPYLAVRYNELNADREAVTARILEHCGLPAAALPDVMRAFERDAQGGTRLARENPAHPLSDEGTARFLRVLARHPRFKSPDLLLPDIDHPDRMV